MKYRKKPVVIEAFQMTQARRWDNSEWPAWLNEGWQKDHGQPGSVFPASFTPGISREPVEDRIAISTLEGTHLVDWDDWIIQGVKGELYPCKPDIFAATYDVAASTPETPIYVYASPVKRLLELPELPEPLVIGPGVAVELRWLREAGGAR